MKRCTLLLLLLVVSLASFPATARGQAADAPYLLPPAEIVAILDAPPLPTAIVSPRNDVIVLVERRSMPGIAELAQPMLRLAGVRINPRTNGPHDVSGVHRFTMMPVTGGAGTAVTVNGARHLDAIGFSPNGASFAFAAMHADRIDLWLVDVSSKRATQVGGITLNTVLTNGCTWYDDSTALLCTAVPSSRGPAPVAPSAPSGPNVQETSGRTAPVRTYQDLLTNRHDEALFTYYATAQLMRVTVAGVKATPIGRPDVIADMAPSPDGHALLVERVRQPYSRLVPWSDFPTSYDVWSPTGALLRTIVDRPMADTVPINGVVTGPRSIRWVPTAPATLTWAEALDKGDLKITVPQRDQLMQLAAPYTSSPVSVKKTQNRFVNALWTDAGVMLVTEFDRTTRRSRLTAHTPGAEPRVLADLSTEDRYANPGRPIPRRGAGTILQQGDAIYLLGDGASPAGDRPFVDRLSLTSREKTRLFQSSDGVYDQPVALLADDGSRLLVRHESVTDVPNYVIVDRASGTRTAITSFKDPAPQLRQVTKKLITYERPDGVKLSGTLYLPPGYKDGTKVPMLMWAYPQEFTDPKAASQVSGSPYRFTLVGGPSHLLLLTQGYAIFDNPTMPIVGPGETANDTYVEQLVASAQAAVDKVVALGVTDRDRIGVGGHSYGAFMTANLLTHSDLFRAGIARSGAYNRTLTPFGFQSETRTYWEVPEIYAKMSPFTHAHKVNEPILLIHGEADNNSGTFPIQSERYYMALKGHGATVRYVTLPNESHGYRARESVLHTVAEMVNWMNLHVKNAAPKR